MDDNATARLQFERDRLDKTITEKHGDSLAQRMHNLCNCVDDNGLPEVHRLLAKSNKHRDYGILASLFSERASASPVPLTYATAPIPTTKLVEDVFRSFQVAGTGLVFTQGLSPFAIICEGHAEMDTVRRMVKKAELAEGGTSMTLADAERLTSADVRFPTVPQVGAEKLYGWSVGADVFHGVNHDVCLSIRQYVINIGPALHRVAEQAGTAAAGMDLVNRVLYESQQEYFQYVTALANGGRPPVPTFADIQSKVLTYRCESLSPLPASWYALVDAPAPTNRRIPQDTAGPRQQSGSAPTFNTFADRTLLRRFRDSEFSTISAMMAGKEVTIPQHASKDVCLVWALKGECSGTCRRKAQHVRYSRGTTSELHSLLDDCGVANPQE